MLLNRLLWRYTFCCVTFIVATMAATACGDDEQAGTSDVVQTSETTADTGNAAAAADVAAAADTAPPDECPSAGGPGCSCTANADCDIGLCLPTLDGRRCARACVENCPPGFACAAAPSPGGGDSVSVCVPSHGLLCDPCTADIDCAVPGLSGTGCLAYEHGERYCAGPCASGCPSGSTCKATTTIEGEVGTFCVRDVPPEGAPICPCTGHAIEARLTTACEVDKTDGAGKLVERCKGVRLCGPDGTATCSEITGAGAVCIDAQCILAGSTPRKDGTACDDGDVCTEDEKCQAGQCGGGADVCPCETDAECLKRNDDDPCNGTLYCNIATHLCAVNPGTVVTCKEDDDPCTTVACNKDTGACQKSLVAPNTPCKDSEPCHQYACDATGACKAEFICECAAASDCVDDGNPCNGQPYCDQPAGGKWTCQTNPATVIKCPPGKDTACVKNLCQPGTAACAMTPLADNATCEDGNACSAGDHCLAGACVAGTTTCPCASDADCAAKDDGDLCNGTLFCNLASGQCQPNPATVVSCPTVDDTDCAFATCQAKTGACVVAPAPVLTVCDDGNPCTMGEVCDGAGACGGVGLANTCTCTNDADCASKDDGDLCNGTMFCNQAAGACVINPATKVSCPSVDDSPCRKNVCLPKEGTCAMVDLAAGKGCDDGEVCTANDTCDAKGGCVAGKTVVCPCMADADCSGVDDGNLCNGVWYCDKGGKQPACKWNPASAVVCKQGDVCAKWACAAASGKCVAAAANTGAGCDDGDACTSGEACAGGVCLSGAATSCDDGDVCTDDACLGGGCTHANNIALCDDGDVCTAGDTCAVGLCSGVTKDCQDGNPCTDDGCLSGQGCSHSVKNCDDGNACTEGFCNGGSGACKQLPVAGGCDDGDACSVGDTCANSVCLAGAAKACEDGNVCTDDACDAASGKCVHPAKLSPCNDGNLCTTKDQCKDGVCLGAGALPCDDGNTCTDDSCDAAKGCVAVANVAPCDDGDQCSEADKCNAGLCGAGGAKDCGDGVECSVDTCIAPSGQCKHDPAKDGVSCEDGSPCTVKDACVAAACHAGAAIVCDDGNPCTVETCSEKAGCVYRVVDLPKVCAGGQVLDTVKIPAGVAWLGCNEALDPKCSANEKPQHQVNLPAYRIDKFEVTVAKYAACVQAKVCATPDTGYPGPNSQVPFNWAVAARSNHPVNGVNYFKAKKYCIWAGGRLPSRNEWEKAARGGCEHYPAGQCKTSARVYPWAGGWKGCNGAVVKDAKGYACGLGTTAPVGSKPLGTSPYGLMDMAGNVYEWVAESAIKGGSVGGWNDGDGWEHRVSAHLEAGGPTTSSSLGFRCAYDVSCSEGDACKTSPSKAGAAKCGAVSVDCDDLSPCTADACDSKIGCTHKPVEGVCTAGVCASGVCEKGLATKIVAGASHTCALVDLKGALGTVWCWGDGGQGRLGNGASQASARPVRAGALQDVADLGTTGGSTCAVAADGRVFCWGRNGKGELGTGKLDATSALPVAVTGVSDATSLSVGPSASSICAVVGAKKEVKCWGANESGQLGTDPKVVAKSASPLAVPGLQGVTAIAAGMNHACAVAAGEVWCWGSKAYLLGDGSQVAGVSGPVKAIGLSNAGWVAAGIHHTCAVSKDGNKLWCWGHGDGGELAGASPGSATPVEIPNWNVGGTPKAGLVGAAYYGSCAVRGGAVSCWGSAPLGEVGGIKQETKSPVQIAGTQGARMVAVASGHACALRTDGGVRCWGRRAAGTLGTGTFPDQPIPVQPADMPAATEVGAGRHTCAKTGASTVRCWGANHNGALGGGGWPPAFVAGSTTNQVPGTVKALAIGGSFSCALLAEQGNVACWGNGWTTGKPHTPAVKPVVVAKVVNATAVSAGNGHVCALGAAGGVWCWGQNGSGQLGDGTKVASASPLVVGAIQGATSIATGAEATCVIVDGKVSCWGYLGWGAPKYTPAPAPVKGLPIVVSVAIRQAACAIDQLGKAWCWGNGGAPPKQMQGLDAVESIEMGASHTCALRKDHTVWCWGQNTVGQLGDGTTVWSGAPVKVAGIDTAAGLAVGYNHSCVVDDKGKLGCWGDNAEGQLGDGGAWSLAATPVFGLE